VGFIFYRKKQTAVLINMVLGGMWIWGWIILSNDGSDLKNDYKPMWDLLLSFQIIYIFIGGASVYVAQKDDNNKLPY